MKTLPIPAEIISAGKSDPMAVIRFLQKKRTVAAPLDPEEKMRCYVSTPSGPIMRPQSRGFGYDCECFGTGWKHGQFMCGRHVPKLPLEYVLG